MNDTMTLTEKLEQAKAEATPYLGPWTVTIVLTDREWGGHEEGGWWFEVLDPFNPEAAELAREWQATRIFWDEREAMTYNLELDNRCQRHNAKTRRPDKSSVLSRGIFEACCFAGYPQRLPGIRPHYE